MRLFSRLQKSSQFHTSMYGTNPSILIHACLPLSAMVRFLCQLDWVIRCSDIWLNIISEFVDERVHGRDQHFSQQVKENRSSTLKGRGILQIMESLNRIKAKGERILLDLTFLSGYGLLPSWFSGLQIWAGTTLPPFLSLPICSSLIITCFSLHNHMSKFI